MKEYTLSREMRDEFAGDIRRVQTAIGETASQRFGERQKCDGIFADEGGVVVNGRSIKIKGDIVVDNYGDRGRNDATPEEIAVVDAIKYVAALVGAQGIDCLKDYEPCRWGDPLRSLTEG